MTTIENWSFVETLSGCENFQTAGASGAIPGDGRGALSGTRRRGARFCQGRTAGTSRFGDLLGHRLPPGRWWAKGLLVLSIAVAAVLLVVVPGRASLPYSYEQQDEAERQQKFLVRLKTDRAKVEMAVKNTKILIDRSRNQPYLPELYLRLAELYIEKSRLAYFIRKHHSGGGQSLDKLETKALKNQAIEVYQRILDHFPDFEARDKVHFFMAHEYKELGQLEQMIAHYRAIISECPASGYVPEAYLLLGDYHFNQEELDQAQEMYQAVLNYPRSPALAVARYKLAWCHINRADYLSALTLLEAAVKSAQGHKLDIDTYKHVDIRLESLVDMAFCYTECHKNQPPDKAMAYFEDYAWSRPAYLTVLEKLAGRYFIKKRWQHAAAIYRNLATLQEDADKLLEYTRNIYDCAQALGTFENAHRDVATIVKALGKQKYSIHVPAEERLKNLTDFELYARDIVTHQHQKARGAKSQVEFQRAADAYGTYLGFFKESPVARDMQANWAEALFSAGDFLEAGRQYEQMAQTTPAAGDLHRETLYSAVISYYNVLKQQGERLDPYQTAYARAGLRAAGNLYATQFPASPQTAHVLFNVAWVAYDEGRHEQSVAEFTRFVDAHPNGREAQAAVHLVLDSLNNQEDTQGLSAYGRKILNDPRFTDSKFKAEIAAIVNNAESKLISELTVAAVDDWQNGSDRLNRFADDHQASSLGHKALQALVVSSLEKGDLHAFFDTGRRMVQQYADADETRSTLGLMIDTGLKVAQFRLVAGLLEDFVDRYPGHVDAPEYGYQAGRIRQTLAQYDAAAGNFRRVLENTATGVDLKAKALFALTEIADRQADTGLMVDLLGQYGTGLSPAAQVRATAGLAVVCYRSGQHQKAQKHSRQALATYSPRLAEQDSRLKAAMAHMQYAALGPVRDEYLRLQLDGELDDARVAAKAKLLARLEKGYQEVMHYQSPDWALAACHSAFEINREFARFLRSAPVPELSAQQTQEYIQLIDQRATVYDHKGSEYLQTAVAQAHKWEICDPRLTAYYQTGSESRVSTPFRGANPASGRIAAEAFQDPDLKPLYRRLLDTPDDPLLLVELAQTYLGQGDFRQALLVVRKALGGDADRTDALEAKASNLLGVAHLYAGNDSAAREAFKQGLAADTGHRGARMNLAALLAYYGHGDKARQTLDPLDSGSQPQPETDVIHPRTLEICHAQVQAQQS